jgi:Gpi18-like mannosyltransferase
MQERGRNTAIHLSGLALLTAGSLYVSFGPSQSDFAEIIAGLALAWLGYGLLVRRPQPIALATTALAIGFLIRVVLIFAFPNLSDDIYRFVWDGRCTHAGVSPYAYLPTALVEQGITGLSPALYSELNSPDYYSVYPPLAQLLYYLSSYPALDLATSAGILKGLHIIIEATGAIALYQIAQSYYTRTKALHITALYYLCPLVIIEGVGNLHHEPMSIGLLLVSLRLLQCRRYFASAVAVVLGAGIKLIPVIAIPFVIYRLAGRARWQYLLGLAVSSSLMAIPLLVGLDIANFAESIDLYFRKFEFNASVYYVSRYIGKLVTGYNLIAYIGPLLALAPVLFFGNAILRWSRDLDVKVIARYCLFGLTLYYLMATTVHPWYIINLLPLAALLGLRYAIVWAVLISLTYINYSYDPYHENLWVVAVEYTIVIGVLLWEITQGNLRSGFRQGADSPFDESSGTAPTL